MKRLLVCSSCLGGLVGLGAVAIREPRVGSLLDRCEAHPSDPELVQATHVVIASPNTIAEWLEQCAAESGEVRSARAEDPAALAESAPLVARLAAQLLAGAGSPLGSTPTEIRLAVSTAREVLAVSKGEALR